MNDEVAKPSRRHVWRIALRALSKSWDDSIFAESAQAGFWSALSLPPLMLGMLGSLAYVAPLFGADVLPSIEHQVISTSHTVFSPSVVNVLRYGYYPALILGLMVGVMILYRVALPVPLPSHRLIFGAILATAVFVIATLGLRIYLKWITSTGYTYGALSTPIAFLLFSFFGGFAIMLGAELNAAIQEEFPAGATHAKRLRNWLGWLAKRWTP